MEKYEVQQKLGDGTYGIVVRATVKRTGEVVAIKKMKQRFRSFEECIRLPEVIALRKLHSCPHVVRLREIFREASGELSLVFEFMDSDLLAVIRRYKQVGIPHSRIRNIAFQALQGLAAIHRLEYFHRDMKPENILVKREGSIEIVKLADLGLAKDVRSRPPFTDYVSTRWYRAPEILLQDRLYNSPVDVWAMGCIMVELFTGRPLFPGTNEQDQLFKIITVTGSPTAQSWPEGLELARKLNRKFPAAAPTSLAALFPSIPPLAVDLITQMIQLNPRQRISAAAALSHPYFQGLEPEATPRPQQQPSVRNPAISTAPSPHTKGLPVDWKDITKQASLDTADAVSSPPPLHAALGGGGGGGNSAFGYASATKPVRLTGHSPLAAVGQQQPLHTVEVSRYSLSPAGQSTAAARRTASDLPPGGSAVQRPLPAPSSSIAPLDVPSSYRNPVTGTRQPNALRESFEGLFKAAGVEVKDVLGKLDTPQQQQQPRPLVPPADTHQTAAASRSTGNPTETTTANVPSSGSSGIRFGRRQSASPPPAAVGEERSPSAVGGSAAKPLSESPVAKLLAQARYRASSGSGSGRLDSENQGITTFKSPSFARRPSPLSASVLQQHQSNAAFDALAAAELILHGHPPRPRNYLADPTAHRQLSFDEQPPVVDRHILAPPPPHYGMRNGRVQGGQIGR